MASVKYPGLTLADAIEFVARANEKVALGSGNRGAELLVLLVPHRRLVQQFELVGRSDDKHFATEVLKVNFAIRAQRGGLNFDSAFQIAGPGRLAGCRVHT